MSSLYGTFADRLCQVIFERSLKVRSDLRFSRLISFLAGILIVTAPSISQASSRLQIFVSVPPQKYFVEQIGKDRVTVNVMVQPGASPHTYEPKPKQMVVIARTKIYFSIGVAFEDTWIKKIALTNPVMEIVPTHHGIKKIAITGHHHEHETDLSEGLDPHIWLSPPLVKIQAQTILTALQKTDPANHSFYETNFQQFIRQVSDLDSDLRDILAGKQQRQFMVFHPSWGYFAQAYGLKQLAIELEGKSPKPAQLKDVIKQGREHGIQIIFVQPQFSARNAKLVARAIKGEVVFVDPLAENWMSNLRRVADKFRQALR
ncbi:MAG: zinc ABC transporter solute-binding protein [Deltaproteobacteria bacterium]|nr:zinc ABC transporter solute-binding protein [Deltaproteobacteria bacterium]MBT4641115.1 zinc ABC transporter solute-binding protein [Deltaproteobacteria bacterium]MBT6505003.1 zinc ABC transporter solute-binding protein [Deltaproteobacteria bacterium]MBT6613536.1 zinc ABC transporter solute-binding protein [Deltaproteobacteria bacterium]MBT7155095.1 zinc ABC transporter solute-binding protein [Deltaproteobacteria bacterium]